MPAHPDITTVSQDSPNTPIERYRYNVERLGFINDSAQQSAVNHLQSIYEALIEKHGVRKNPFAELFTLFRSNRNIPVKGLYIWGDVGRGKTLLVDMFSECLPFEQKLRIHFHRFMQKIHNELKSCRDMQDPLAHVARKLADNTKVICFDEFFVSDIGDAMILAGILTTLFDSGVTLIATSNSQPDELYKDGLQRAKFLPAIELIKKHTQVLNLDNGIDYRLRYLDKAEIYHFPLDDTAESNLEECFVQITPEPGSLGTSLEILGREIASKRCADGIVWFEFEEICGGPRSHLDYIELAKCFHTVLISNVPVFGKLQDNAARRFIALVDEFYDRNVNLILSAETSSAKLYQGERLKQTFERTTSRLEEMQSHDYLSRPHRP